ncbi:MAG: TetR/AcrR family transcriptional regulator [Myxococcota bacterium]
MPKQPSSSTHGRLWADDRRKQILAVAARLLDEQGVDGLRIPDVAEAAGVTRPVIYRHFPNRQAILMDLLEEMGSALAERLEGLAASGLEDLEKLMPDLFEGLCDEIEARGAGVWKLLNSAGPDPEVEAVAQRVRERLVAPWYARVASVTRTSGEEAVAVTSIIYAVVPPLITLWHSGTLSRAEAVSHLTRAVGAIVGAYQRPAELH